MEAIAVKMEKEITEWWCNLLDKERFKIIKEAYKEKCQ